MEGAGVGDGDKKFAGTGLLVTKKIPTVCVGDVEGDLEGDLEGDFDGFDDVGELVGARDGDRDGFADVGDLDGKWVGILVGPGSMYPPQAHMSPSVLVVPHPMPP
jgi:hypothetical protein